LQLRRNRSHDATVGGAIEARRHVLVAMAFADEPAIGHQGPGLEIEAQYRGAEAVQARLRVISSVDLGEAGDELLGHALHDRREQASLVAEELGDARLGSARVAHDAVQAGAGKTVPAKHRIGVLQDPAPAGLRRLNPLIRLRFRHVSASRRGAAAPPARE
jgi:hypothetical protein